MERKFTIVYGGYAIHAGGKPLPDGTYAPTLAIAFGEERARTDSTCRCRAPAPT